MNSLESDPLALERATNPKEETMKRLAVLLAAALLSLSLSGIAFAAEETKPATESK